MPWMLLRLREGFRTRTGVLIVKAYLGLGSRYSYLASTQLERIGAETGAVFDWVPVNSVDLIRRARAEGSPFDASEPGGAYAPAFRDLDAARWAAHYRVPYHAPDIAALPSDAMARLCWSQEDAGRRWEIMMAVYAAVFAQGVRMTRDVLAGIGSDFGLSRDEIGAAIEGPHTAQLHESALEEAMSQGAFGVPTFVCEDTLFWGNDRLPLLVDHLVKREAP